MEIKLSHDAKYRVLFELQMALKFCDEKIMPERYESIQSAIREINQIPSK